MRAEAGPAFLVREARAMSAPNHRLPRWAALITVVAVVGCSSPAADAPENASPLRVVSPPAPVASPALVARPAAAPKRARAAAPVPVRALTGRLRPDVMVVGAAPLPAEAMRRLLARDPRPESDSLC